MMNLKVLLILLLFVACEKQSTEIDPFECMTCIRTTEENGVLIRELELFFCGEELEKQRNINYMYVDYYGNMITVSTRCYKEPCKSR
jgi:hypothetical protein